MKVKINSLLIAIICISNYGNSQFKSDPNFNNSDKNLKNEFYEILTSNSELNISNLAAISTEDSKLDLKGNIKISDKTLLNIGVNGSINEGVSTVFSGLKVSPSLGTNLGLHIFISDNDYYSKLTNQYIFKEKQDSLIREKEINLIKFVDLTGKVIPYDTSKPSQTLVTSNGKTIPFFMYKKYVEQNDIVTTEQELIIKLNKEISAHKKSITNGFITENKKTIPLTKKDVEILNNKIASKTQKISLSEDKIIKIKEVLNEYLSVANIISSYDALEEKYNQEMEKTYEIKKPEEYRISWLSLTGSLKNNSIKLFDEKADFDNQISKSSFNNLGIDLSFNIYNLTINDHKTYFLKFGVSHEIKDNLRDLSVLKIEQVNIFNNPSDTSSVSSRTSKSEIAAYEKEEYKTNIRPTSLFIDGYWFFSRKNNFALHLRPELNFIEKEENLNLGTGLFLSFNSKDKENPIVNIELYTNFVDVLKENDEENKLLDRSNTSLSLNFPITFKTNQK